MQKKVSVIIPFYNGVEWLIEAVQSVVDQTYKNVEIIVVNDGSNEDIKHFLDKFGNKIVYEYQENQGPAAARNHGIQIATGDYYAFEDADDIWLPTKLEKQIGFMEEHGFAWSHTGFYNWWPENNKLELSNNISDFDDISKQIIVSCHIATPSVVVSRSVLDDHPQIRFAEDRKVGEDTKFYKQLSKLYPIALVEEPLVKVRMRGNNSFSNVLKRFEIRSKVYLDKEEQLPRIIRLTGKIYEYYNKIFGIKQSSLKVLLAKFMLVLPYTIERFYVKNVIKKSKKDDMYLLRTNN